MSGTLKYSIGFRMRKEDAAHIAKALNIPILTVSGSDIFNHGKLITSKSLIETVEGMTKKRAAAPKAAAKVGYAAGGR